MTSPEDIHKFSQLAVDCLQAMGDHTFRVALHTVPWGGRPHVLGRRYIMQKYLTNEDIAQAHWVNEQAKRIDPQWRDKEPGLSHLANLMQERSGFRWHLEQAEYQKSTPSQWDYITAEFGEATSLMLTQHRKSEASSRRAGFKLVTPD
jgi:hypothetical protein